jgi:sulfide dehydrogenase cytochrome subunit
MPSRFVPAWLISASLALCHNAHAQAPGAVDLTTACAGCHGIDGKGHGDIPVIAGLPESSLALALREFKSGRRPSTVMQRIASAYSDSEIDELAAQFSGHAPTP